MAADTATTQDSPGAPVSAYRPTGNGRTTFAQERVSDKGAPERRVESGSDWRRSSRTAPKARTNLVEAVAGLRTALHQSARVDGLADVQALTDQARSSVPDAPMWQALARAVRGLAETVERIRTHATSEVPGPSGQSPPPTLRAGVAPADSEAAQVSSARRSPGNRQVIQVTIASSLAVVAGELLSPARWYWAVIAAFVIYSGTTSRGQTLTRGWQRNCRRRGNRRCRGQPGGR